MAWKMSSRAMTGSSLSRGLQHLGAVLGGVGLGGLLGEAAGPGGRGRGQEGFQGVLLALVAGLLPLLEAGVVLVGAVELGPQGPGAGEDAGVLDPHPPLVAVGAVEGEPLG